MEKYRDYPYAIKAICSDVDGTLLRSDKTLSDESLRWIRKAREEKNVPFILVSGRMLNSLEALNRRIGSGCLTSGYSGGVLYDSAYNEIYDIRLERRIASAAIREGRKLGLDMIYFSGKEWYMEGRDNFTYRRKIVLYGDDCIIASLSEMVEKEEANKVLAMSEDPDQLEEWKNAVLEAEVKRDEVFFYRGGQFLEILPSSFSKGTAVEAIAKRLGIGTENIMALGDDSNDTEMLRTAGLGIAMENSVPEALSAAYTVCDSNDEDGLAKSIRKYVFGL